MSLTRWTALHASLLVVVLSSLSFGGCALQDHGPSAAGSGAGWAQGSRAATDLDGDGMTWPEDECPEDPEDLDDHQDGDGCPEAGYAFVTPPGLAYGESADVLLQVDPARDAVSVGEELRQQVEQAEQLAPEGTLPALRGAVESTLGRWAPCMDAELKETTVASITKARDLDPARERLNLEITPAGDEDPNGPLIRELALDKPAAEWHWHVRAVRPGRTQVVLRLYALEQGPDGRCDADSRRRVQTFQHRMAVEVSAARLVEDKLPAPWLWSLALLPVAALIAVRRRLRARPVLPDDKGAG